MIIIMLIVLVANTALAAGQSGADNSAQPDIHSRVDSADFHFANNQRYTITGKLPYEDTHIDLLPALSIGALYSGIFVLQHYGQSQTIWSELGDFEIVEDGNYAFYVDKAGHFYGCYLASYLMSEALIGAGFSWDASTNIGALLGLGYSSYVEILDGFGEGWGFSPSDLYCDIAGAAFFWGQHYVPWLENITPKYMYIPSPWFGENKRRPSTMFQDDYSSNTFFLSFNIHNMLPDQYSDYWPEWLQLSVGYAARNLCDNEHDEYKCDPSKRYVELNGYYGSPRFIIALDYNFAKILPEGHFLWNWVRQGMMYFKFPAPAIEFGPTTRVFMFYPFHFQLNLDAAF